MKSTIVNQRFPALLLVSFFSLACVISCFEKQRSAKPVTDVGAFLQNLTHLETLQDAYAERRSNFQITQTGRIIKILNDDLKGSRHQRFIVRLKSGQTLLIAHNIDVAPYVQDLAVGIAIIFQGEYEHNNKGGVVHWTHRDSRHKHPHGWLVYKGYQYD